MSNLFYFQSKEGNLVPSNTREFAEFLKKNDKKTLWADFHRTTGVRTIQQNKALHKYFELLAKEMNDAGYTVQLVLKEKVDLDWDASKIKELIWRPAQEAITGKKSTTQLDKVEDITLIFEHLTRHLGEKFGIFVDFPQDQKPDIAPIN